LGSARTSTEIHALCDDLIRMTAPQLLAAVQADLPTVGFFDELSFLRRHWNDVLWSTAAALGWTSDRGCTRRRVGRSRLWAKALEAVVGLFGWRADSTPAVPRLQRGQIGAQHIGQCFSAGGDLLPALITL